MVFDNRVWAKARHANLEVQRNVKHCLVQSIFILSFYLAKHQKGAHLYQKGAIQRGATDLWGGSCPKLPPLHSHHHRRALVGLAPQIEI